MLVFFPFRSFTQAIGMASLLLLNGCLWETPAPSDLIRIQEENRLRIGTLNTPQSYYIGPEGPMGLDYELAVAFADYLGVKLEIFPLYTVSGLFPALDRKEVDILAAGLSLMPERLEKYANTPAYYFTDVKLVYKKGQKRPKTLHDLVKDPKRLVVLKGSSHEHYLQQLQKENLPDLKWETQEESDSDDLLQQLGRGEIDYTLADASSIALAQRVMPDIAVALSLKENEAYTWFLNKNQDDSLQALLIEFFNLMRENGQLAQLEEKYFGHIDQFDYVDSRAFIRALDRTLPKWQSLFQRHARDFDWRLLAALAYQESHWDPLARSPTGVRGMMMLTTPTAKSVGVTNRLDPEQSIQGGAKYLERMVKRIPDSVIEHEKIWFALASYNIGFGHLMDARRLTEQQGGNPNTWRDVKDRLPLLRQRKYHKTTRYGYARGDEAVHYVESIRRYYQSIIGHESRAKSPITLDGLTTVDGLKTATFENREVPLKSTEISSTTLPLMPLTR